MYFAYWSNSGSSRLYRSRRAAWALSEIGRSPFKARIGSPGKA
jgi:hypothetical protein